ncbi:16S rRNA (cytosine(1402)-N(4))-methyltransferase RsmH [Cerasicoccus maritimus]|uniref:16S rRNA (cytosine(1402)-N(4))-methyltransferase RsmH n=1 Tax=Cerasicoccus maritimus TaxID=490089 RepID=UPI0028528D3B|nr:16S rRNA (cytosine(1402)-N(4))-methyltransferase RsmH [Cerasicoccus maritimus]
MGHLPVLLREVLECFSPIQPGRYLDGTFGGGGHTTALLEANEGVHVTGLDCDPAAAERAAALRERYPERFSFFDLNFRKLDKLTQTGFTGVLLDLGVSSFQLDQAERGFSFREDAPADMRLNPRQGVSAAEFLETASRDDVVRAIRDQGEEKQWRRVVDAILAARGTGKLQTTAKLAELIAANVSQRRGERIHPATKSFQGIRIAVNDELGAIDEVLPKAFEALAPGGVLAVISFHSLEDRPVKRFFNRVTGRPEHGRDSRAQDERVQLAERLTRKPIVADEAKIAANPRSRSAKLRAVRKLTTPLR